MKRIKNFGKNKNKKLIQRAKILIYKMRLKFLKMKLKI